MSRIRLPGCEFASPDANLPPRIRSIKGHLCSYEPGLDALSPQRKHIGGLSRRVFTNPMLFTRKKSCRLLDSSRGPRPC
eukprot:6591940-Pyramimonas_sp.AAC.1